MLSTVSTAGLGNTDEETYPRQLERCLQEAHPDREVLVFATAQPRFEPYLATLAPTLVFALDEPLARLAAGGIELERDPTEASSE